MKQNIYPRNYFTPYDEFTTPEEIPTEIKADEDSEEIIRNIMNKISRECQDIFKRNDSRFILNKFRIMVQLEMAEILTKLYKLKGE
ncbi:MAG: hypothetical protein IPM32_14245 [Ignavibacteriae bacterium]|nr:hypothetical protein [Ignavibacteriota bacterium]